MNKIEELALNMVGTHSSVIKSKYPCGAWCAATVSYIISQVDKKVDTNISCTQLAKAWSKNPRMIEVKLETVQSGDIMFIDWDKSGDCDHVVIVVQYDGDISTGLVYVNGNGNSSEIVTKQSLDYDTLKRKVCRVFRYVGDTVSNQDKNVSKPQLGVSNQVKSEQIDLEQLSKGKDGKSVKILQALLIAAGYSCGPYKNDGDFGGSTEAAVRTYQRENGLSDDGIVGVQTWNKLLS